MIAKFLLTRASLTEANFKDPFTTQNMHKKDGGKKQ